MIPGFVALLFVGFFIKTSKTLIVISPISIFILIGLILFLGVPIYNLLNYTNIYYAITNKRVLFQSGVIGRDFKIVDFDQITNAQVNVGILDKLFGDDSGSILVSSAGTFVTTRQGQVARPYTLRNIENPYDVFKFFKKVSHDIKTDIYYPNKLRPKSNPGYKTGYNPKK
jgi:uncharacterized membrane protein YdbT with pleckstrin-like domain